jgi:dihydroxyacetone kinase-like protein
MTDSLSKTVLKRMFSAAAMQIRDRSALLSKLDSVGGDGDHGATMVRFMERLEQAMDATDEKSTSAMLKEAGWSSMDADGGASCAILGTFVAGMGDVEIGEELDSRCLSESFHAGLRAVLPHTKARQGDKTMMDALLPAVEALEQAALLGQTTGVAMKAAAVAAEQGAIATRQMIAHHGRAKSIGERSLGHPDPGATSVAILFAAFSSALVGGEAGRRLHLNSIDESESYV